MTRPPSARLDRLPSMKAWLNDYRPKPGKYMPPWQGGILSGLKPRKGKYRRVEK